MVLEISRNQKINELDRRNVKKSCKRVSESNRTKIMERGFELKGEKRGCCNRPAISMDRKKRKKEEKRSLRSLRKEIREMAAPLLGFLSDIYDYAGLTSLLHFDWFIALAARGRL